MQTSNTQRINASLSTEEIEFYHHNGYIIVPSVFSTDEIDQLANDVEQLLLDRSDALHSNNLRVRFCRHQSTAENIFDVLDPIADLSAYAHAIANDTRILNRLASIYGEPACLFKDKLIYKRPGAAGAGLHQDWIGWPGFPKSFLTVLIAIDPFTLDGGATMVYPRLHQKGYLSPVDGKHHELQHSDLPTEPVPLILEPGDIAIFSGFAPHFSEPNHSTRSRRGYFVSYNAQSDGGDQYASHYAEFHRWIRERYPVERQQQLVFE